MRRGEHMEQCALIQWVRLESREIEELDLLYAIPNGAFYGGDARIRAIRGQRMKAEGVKPNVPDLFLSVARGGSHGLYIEMKYGDNRPTKDQKKVMQRLRNEGYRVDVCYSSGAAQKVIIEYLKGGKNGS